MKRHLSALTAGALLALLSAFPMTLAAQDEFPIESPPPNTWLGITGGRFAPSDAVFQEVYGKGGLALGLGAGRELYRSGGFTLAAAFEIRRFARTGYSTISQIESRLALTPLAALLETHFRRGAFGIWLGAGPGLVFYKEDSEWILSRGAAIGLHIAGGLIVEVPSGPVLRAHLRWSGASKAMEDFDVGLGGVELGGSILFRFRL